MCHVHESPHQNAAAKNNLNWHKIRANTSGCKIPYFLLTASLTSTAASQRTIRRFSSLNSPEKKENINNYCEIHHFLPRTFTSESQVRNENE